MLLSGSINTMYNAPLNKEGRISDYIYSDVWRSIRFLHNVLINEDEKIYSVLVNTPLYCSPARWMTDPFLFYRFVQRIKLYDHKWHEAFDIVSELLYDCCGFNLFCNKDNRFIKGGHDFKKFDQFRRNNKHKL